MDKEEMKEILSSLMKECKEELKNLFQTELGKINITVQKLQDSVEFISAKYDEIISENKVLKQEIIDLKNGSTKQNNIINALEKTTREIKKQVNTMDNTSRFEKLELHGVPKSSGENAVRVSLNVLKIANPELNYSDIADAFRVNTDRRENNKPGPIIVTMKCKEKRSLCFSNRKKLMGFNFKDIGLEADRIFINENLCPNTRQLLYKAKLLKNEHKRRFLWTNNGTIKMKKTTDSTTIIILDEMDLKKKITPTTIPA